MSEVKTYRVEFVEDRFSKWMSKDDHDRVVAEKDKSYDNLDNVNMKLNETIAELKAFKVAAIAENQELKRVVEKLKRYTQHRVDCICRAGVLEYANDCDCGLDDIEKEGV